MRVRFFFAWFDAWLGVFVDEKKRKLYLCPVPCAVTEITHSGSGVSVEGNWWVPAIYAVVAVVAWQWLGVRSWGGQR